MNRIILLAFVLSALPLLSPPAQANKVKKLSLKAPDGFGDAPTVVVYSSQGEKWDKVDKTASTKFRVGLNAKCKYEGRGNKAYRGSLIVPGFTLIGSHKPPDFLIPNSHDASGTFRYENGNGQPTSAIKVCADELGKRLSANADLTKYDILAKGFTVNYPAAFRVSFGLTCKPTGIGFADYASKSVVVNARVQCTASDLAQEKIPKPVAKPKRAVLVPLVKQVTFHADPPEYTGACPTGIGFKGKITVNRAGTVKYRYVSHDGKKSPDFSLKFTAAGTQATRKWHRTLSKPDPGKTLSAGGKQPKWDHTGWYRIEILSPKVQESVKAVYKVDCTVPSKARAIKIK
jgi:hypothetical protein